jgi:hypothetical protein
MCVVSAVHQQIGPMIDPNWKPGYVPAGIPAPVINPFPWPPTPPKSLDADILKEIRDILPRLDRIDKALGLKDCSAEEADKAAFRQKLDELIAAAEAIKAAST